MVENVHVEPDGAAGDLATDSAHADNAERRAVDLVAVQDVGVVGKVVGPAGVAPALDDVAADRHEHGKGHVGGDAVDETGCETDREAAGLGVFQVDVVDADAKVAETTQLGHLVHKRAGYYWMAVDDEAFDLRQDRVICGEVPDVNVAAVDDHARHVRRQR